MRNLLLIMLVLALTGCASKQISSNDATGVPFNRVAKPELLKEKSGMVKVILIREDAFLGGIAASANIWTNGEPLASLHSGETVTLWMKPDFYVFKLTSLTRGSKQFQPIEHKLQTIKVEVDAKTSRRYELRVDLSSALGWEFEATSIEVSK